MRTEPFEDVAHAQFARHLLNVDRLARYVLQEITDALRLLASRPGIGHLRQDLTPLPVKFWPVFSYLIVYDPAARPLAVVRVFHGRQDVAAILSRGAE